MQTLRDHTILYDEDCPMCKMYTGAFVATKMLDKNGRQAYQQMPENIRCKVDTARAVNEIALLNSKTGEVKYGVRSLFIILQNSFPMLKALFNSNLFFWFADKSYKFISYNRRVIVPSGYHRESSFRNAPSFHSGYRLVYLLFTWLTTAFILYGFSRNLVPVVPASNFYREFAICGGQILWQSGFMLLADRHKTWDYLGNMMTISFAGGLLLLLVQTFAGLAGIENSYFFAASFLLVAGLMLLEHIRRTKLLRISWILSLSWVVYRVILLFFVL